VSVDAPTDAPVRVLVVDRYELPSLGVRTVLGGEPWVESCITAHTPEAGLRLTCEHRPHVVLLGMSLGLPEVVALGRRLATLDRVPRVLLLGDGHPVSPTTSRCIGAWAIVHPHWNARDLSAAVRQVAVAQVADAPRPTGAHSALSEREQDILRLVATGATNREIGRSLYLSPNTVKQHASGAYRKLGARNRAEAVQRAQRLGLLELGS
jgi:DNA-binding NarL/FixJ family response regulator